MEILIITGLSGSGKSKAASIMEDIGYYTVDNLPAEMMVRFARFCTDAQGKYDRLAFIYDVRTAEPPERLCQALDDLKREANSCKVLFLDCDTETIIHRYKETRRSHPLLTDKCSTEQAVDREREMMEPVRRQADIVLNTSVFSVAKLRGELLQLFGKASDRRALQVDVMSFGFKHGLPMEADLVLDVRFLPNPYYVDALKRQTGLDAPVRDFVFSYAQTNTFMEKVRELLSFLLALYSEEGKTMLVIAIGCTGGHHRSAAIAHALADYIAAKGYTVTETHRDISR